MKKSLVVLLALVMVLAFAATAVAANPGSGDTQIASYTDLADTKDEWAAAVYKLTALGVLQGDGIGTKYRPADNLTRGEFAVIATYLAGVEDQVAFYATKPAAFSDANGWEKGYVNCAYANDLMIGRSATKFDPKGKVSMQEVATVVLRVLGYNFDSTYPVGYANKAEAIGLLDYVQYVGPTYINRAEMASVAAQALDCFKVNYVGKDNTLVNALGLVDKDGYQYVSWSTNETANIEAIIRDALKGDVDELTIKDIIEAFFEDDYAVTMLYDVFGAIDLQVTFDGYVNNGSTNGIDPTRWLEASGWAYTDFTNGQVAAILSEIKFDGLGYSFDEKAIERVHIPFADEYYIYEGDLVDLGARVGTVTLYLDNPSKIAEIAFIDLDTDLVLSGTKEYFANTKWNTDKTGSGISYYKFMDYAAYDDAYFGVVKSATNDKVTMVDGSPLDDQTLKGYNVVFWNMDTKQFVLPTDLVKGDVIYKAGTGLAANYTTDNNYDPNLTADWVAVAAGSTSQAKRATATLYLVYNATEGTLSKYNNEYITVDDVKYNALDNSKYSKDALTNLYDWYNVDGMAKEVKFVGAYVPGYFTYVSNATYSYAYGVIDSYIYDTKTVNGYLDEYDLDVKTAITGVKIITPSGEVVTYEFSKKLEGGDIWDVLGDDVEAGDLVNYTLNKDGKICDIEGRLSEELVTYVEFGDGRIDQLTVTKNDKVVIDDVTYDLANDAVIYILKSETEGVNEGMYDIGSGKVVSKADFLNEFDGDVYARKVAIAKGNTSKNTINVLYIIDTVVETKGFGVSTKWDHYLVADDDDDYKFVVLDGKTFTMTNLLFEVVCNEVATAGDNFFVLYEAENGEIVRAAVVGKDALLRKDRAEAVKWYDEDGDENGAALNDTAAPVVGEFLIDNEEMDKDYYVGSGTVTAVNDTYTRIEIKTNDYIIDDSDKENIIKANGEKVTLWLNNFDFTAETNPFAVDGTIMYIYQKDDDDMELVSYIFTPKAGSASSFAPGWWWDYII